MASRVSSWLCVFVAAIATFSHGCSPEEEVLPRQEVSGTVTFLGEPLKTGSIELRPIAGGAGASSVGGPIQDGSFQIKRDSGPVPGKYKVLIVSNGGSSAKEGEFVEPGTRAKPPRELIPAKYNQSSTLATEVVSDGPNVMKFDLVK